MNKSIKVSIVVPVYNVEKYLDRCVQSLLNQTMNEIEVILVDDGSTDNCPQLCDTYKKQDCRIKVVHKKNEGLGMARNTGVENAEGEYIAFVDSDDFVDMDFYEKLYKSAQKYDTDMTYGEIKNVNEKLDIKYIEEIIMDKTVYLNEKKEKNVFLATFEREQDRLGISSCRALYKKENFEKYNIRFVSEREFISEDYIFNLDYIPICDRISIVKGSYYNYCYNNTSLTHKYRNDRFEASKYMYLHVIEKFKKVGMYNINSQKVIKHDFIVNIRVSIKQEKMNPSKVAKKNIKRICMDRLTQECINSGYKQTTLQKIFDTLIRLKMYNILYIIISKRKY